MKQVSPRTAVRLTIMGLVHGVFFRASLAQVAKEEGVRGWVRNLADGSVEAVLEGDEMSVERVVKWTRRGPPRARVDSVQVTKVEPRDAKGFKILG